MLKGDEAALIESAVAGRCLSEIAAAGGVSVSTAQRRLRDSEIVAAVREGRSRQRREAVGRLNSGLSTAIERLGELLHDADPHVALRAAGMVLGNAHKFATAVDFEERLTALEQDPRVGDEEQDLRVGDEDDE